MIKDIITDLCKQKGMSLNGLEKELGFSNYTISRWETSAPRVDNLIKVANYFDVTLDYLIGNTGQPIQNIKQYHNAIFKMSQDRRQDQRRSTDNDANLILQELSSIIKSYGGDLAPETRKIPIVGTIKCGPNGICYEDISAYLLVDESIHGDLFVLRTRGDSMMDKGIDEGDLAIIRKQEDVESGEIAAVLIDNTEATLKKVVKIPNGVALEAANSKYETRYFIAEDLNKIKILGKLVEIRKRF